MDFMSVPRLWQDLSVSAAVSDREGGLSCVASLAQLMTLEKSTPPPQYFLPCEGH